MTSPIPRQGEMDYTQLTDDQKRKMLEAELLSFEAQHYQQSLRMSLEQSNVAHLETMIQQRREALAALK